MIQAPERNRKEWKYSRDRISCSKSLRFIVLGGIFPLLHFELLVASQANVEQPVESLREGRPFELLGNAEQGHIGNSLLAGSQPVAFQAVFQPGLEVVADYRCTMA